MPDLTAKRTLVKSPPELWEELSEVEGLAKHLGAFGEIKITKLEPEHTVAWEGEHASGTVSIEPSGWGTKVTLHAELAEEEVAEAEPEPVAVEPEPVAEEPAAAEEQPIAEEPIAIEEPVARQPAAVTVESDALTVEPEASAVEIQPERKRRGFWGWLFRTRTGSPAIEEPEPVAIEPEPVAVEPEPEPVAIAPEPVAPEPEPEPEPKPEPEPEVEEAEPAAAESEPQPEALHPERARAILDEALDALGAAHHRPFSRG
jgi:hypothetical protein